MIFLFISDQDNLFLMRCPTHEEIKDTAFHMDAHSAPGPDEFSGVFYKTFSDVVAKDVCAAVQSFFNSGVITSGFNFSLMILIPKVANAITIE